MDAPRMTEAATVAVTIVFMRDSPVESRLVQRLRSRCDVGPGANPFLKTTVVYALLGASLLVSCASALPKAGPIVPGDYVRRTNERLAVFRLTYRVHVPPVLDEDA